MGRIDDEDRRRPRLPFAAQGKKPGPTKAQEARRSVAFVQGMVRLDGFFSLLAVLNGEGGEFAGALNQLGLGDGWSAQNASVGS